MSNDFESKCSTRTFIAVNNSENIKFTIENLLKLFEKSKRINFGNCVLLKIKNVTCKIFTNLTIHLTGLITIEKVIEVINSLYSFNHNLDLKLLDYKVYCAMNNWSINFKKKINLNETMVNLNKNGYLSYFLRGIPLINKIQAKNQTKLINLKFYEDSNFNIINEEIVFQNKTVTLLMFKSGKCLVSGPSENLCFNILTEISKYIIVQT